jgi:hypothetical protein
MEWYILDRNYRFKHNKNMVVGSGTQTELLLLVDTPPGTSSAIQNIGTELLGQKLLI